MMIIKHFAFHIEISIIYALIISQKRNGNQNHNNNNSNMNGNVMKKRETVKWKWIWDKFPPLSMCIFIYSYIFNYILLILWCWCLFLLKWKGTTKIEVTHLLMELKISSKMEIFYVKFLWFSVVYWTRVSVMKKVSLFNF